MSSEQHPEIPKGYYCYTTNRIEYGPKTDASAKLAEIFGSEDRGEILHMHTTPCPHWRCDPTLSEQERGICTLLHINDQEHHTLLWDQVKECNFNIEIDPDDLQFE